jgi:sortase A
MGWNFRRAVVKRAGLLIGLTLFLGVSACAGLIKIERIPTPTPTPTPSPTPTTDIPPSGVPSRIVAEAIALDAPVVEMGWQLAERGEQTVNVWAVPENEAGWHRNSARPGQGSNVVISGHNNSTGGHVFGNIEELALGDQVTLWDDEGTAYMYQVTDRQIVQAFAASQEALDYLQAVVRPTPNEQLTLITCWPNWTNTHRLIVIARPL